MSDLPVLQIGPPLPLQRMHALHAKGCLFFLFFSSMLSSGPFLPHPNTSSLLAVPYAVCAPSPYLIPWACDF